MLSLFSQSFRCHAFIRALSTPSYRLYSKSPVPTADDPFLGKMQRKTEEELANLVNRASESSVASSKEAMQALAENEAEEEMVDVSPSEHASPFYV